jgi:hypothetical protein
MCLRPLSCWNCGFESRRGHGCLSLVSGVYCQSEDSASDSSLVQGSPAECGVLECDREADNERPWPSRGCCAMEQKFRRNECDTVGLRTVTVLQENVFRIAAPRSCVCLVMYLAIHK